MTRLGLPTRLKLRRSLGLGANLGIPGGGGGSYTQNWVHFDGDNSLLTINTAGSDQSKVLLSVWVGNTGTGPAPGAPDDDNIIICTYPNGMFEVATLNNINGHPSSPMSAFIYSGLDYSGIQMDSDNIVYPIVGRKHFAFSLDLNHADPDKRQQYYINGIAAPFTNSQTNAGAMTIAFSQETEIKIGFNGISQSFGVFDMADFQFWAGIGPDLAVSSNIENLIKNGAAVNPSDAAAAFGPQSVLLSGNAAAFPINQGTLGTASLIGSLTNA